MPRPSAYSRTRRLVMQASMVGVLLATVGAAALLARVRERRWAVTLTTTPHLTDRLAMRLPRGWRVDQTLPDEAPLTVTATQGAAGEDGLRVLEVVQFPVDADVEAEGVLAEYLATQPGIAGSPEPFGFLGRPGVVVPFVHQERHPLAPHITIGEWPEWYAATVLPSSAGGGQNLGVILHLGGRAAGGPSGPATLRQIADGLTPRAADPSFGADPSVGDDPDNPDAE